MREGKIGNVRVDGMKEEIREDYERMGRDAVRVRGGREREERKRGSYTAVVWDGIGLNGRRMDGAKCQHVSG